IITNLPEDHDEPCTAPLSPHNPDAGQRHFSFTRELWIERDDFREDPEKRYFRLFPGNKVRLKYAYIVECTGFKKDEDGNVTEVYAEYIPDTKSGTPGASSIRVRGAITWVSVKHALSTEVRLYDRLFTDPHPDIGDKYFLTLINPDSMQTVQACIKPCLVAKPEDSDRNISPTPNQGLQGPALSVYAGPLLGSASNTPFLPRYVSTIACLQTHTQILVTKTSSA